MGPERSRILEGRLWGCEAKAARGTCTTPTARNACEERGKTASTLQQITTSPFLTAKLLDIEIRNKKLKTRK